MAYRRRETLIEIRGLEQIPRLSRELQDALNEAVQGVTFDIANQGVQIARRLAYDYLPSGGGSYRRSIQVRTQIERDRLDVIIESDHPFAQAIEFGTRPHLIEGRPNLLMEDFIPGGSQRAPKGVRYIRKRVIRRRARHPGARAFHVFRDASILLRRRLPTIIDKNMREAGFT